MIDMMEFGVVIHHGSMPLKARLMTEEFIRGGHARICFATSTLNQGINMPFDIVWIDNFNKLDTLTLKNLIGRSGRSTKSDKFDYGFTVVKKSNVATFTKRFSEVFPISEVSALDYPIENIDEDHRDTVEAIHEDAYDDDHRLTDHQIERLKEANLDDAVALILNTLLDKDGNPLTGKEYYDLKKSNRDKVKTAFKEIFVSHLRRKELEKAENYVLSASIPVLLWHIEGKSFSEIVSLRHAYITRKDERRVIEKELKSSRITVEEAEQRHKALPAKYSQIPFPLPRKGEKAVSTFLYVPAREVQFDKVVFDTYDYLDKVVSLSLSDPICAALDIYHEKHGDERAAKLIDYIRYGTNDPTDIWLLRYGFGFEDIEWIKKYVRKIDANGIDFYKNIGNLKEDQRDVIERYV